MKAGIAAKMFRTIDTRADRLPDEEDLVPRDSLAD